MVFIMLLQKFLSDPFFLSVPDAAHKIMQTHRLHALFS